MTLYYKTRQILLQNATAVLLQNATDVYYKIHQVFYYEMRQFYYKMQQLLQIATVLLQKATFITNCDSTFFERKLNAASHLTEPLKNLSTLQQICLIPNLFPQK